MIAELNELRATSEAIDNSKPIQVPSAMAPNDMLPQGDIGLLMLESLPGGCEELSDPFENGDLQLAPGNTRGSRHMIPVKFKRSIKVYLIRDGDPLSDLCIEATEPFDLTHPEHADHLGYPPGIYRVRHQQNAQRERVLD